MHRYVCRGWFSYAPWEEALEIGREYLFTACLRANSLVAARTVARSLMPARCNNLSVVCIDTIPLGWADKVLDFSS
jgi:hypothetical protein